MVAATQPTTDIRELLLESPQFGAEEVKRLARAFASGQGGEVRQVLYDLERQVDAGKAPEPRVMAAGIANHLLARQAQAVRYLSQISGNGVAEFYLGEALLAQGKPDEAARQFESAGQHGYDPIESKLRQAGSVRQCGKPDEAEKLVRSSGREGATRAEYSYQMGCIFADRGDIHAAIEYFERAVDMDPHHSEALFRLAALNDLVGNDDEAIKLYEQSLSRPPIYLGALMNLGLLYEDKENYSAAEFCFRRVLEFDPAHERARLYMKDIEATGDMYYDEDELRRQQEIEQLMRIPVTDFELSARARNCLERAGIESLGDLARINEQDLLAGKNFGETSLREIRELMETRGLRIGQFADEEQRPRAARAFQPEPLSPQEKLVLDAPVGDLNLSVRARKCLTKLGISSLGELTSRSPDELLAIRNFGVTSLNEIREKLSERNLKLRGD